MIVLDASVLANALADHGADGDDARKRLREAAQVAAPDLIDIETVSVLRRRWLAGTIAERRFARAVDDLADVPVTRYPTLPLMRRAYELRHNLTAYDACYVALAEALDWPLVTADARLSRAPGLQCEVRLVTECD